MKFHKDKGRKRESRFPWCKSSDIVSLNCMHSHWVIVGNEIIPPSPVTSRGMQFSAPRFSTPIMSIEAGKFCRVSLRIPSDALNTRNVIQFRQTHSLFQQVIAGLFEDIDFVHRRIINSREIAAIKRLRSEIISPSTVSKEKFADYEGIFGLTQWLILLRTIGQHRRRIYFVSATPKEAEQSEIKTDQAQIAPVLIFLHYFTSRHKRLGHYTTSITYDSQLKRTMKRKMIFFAIDIAWCPLLFAFKHNSEAWNRTRKK